MNLLKIISFTVPVLAVLIMIFNSFTHPPQYTYDYSVHAQTIKINEVLWRIFPVSPVGQLEYNPPWYYYIFGKLNHLIEEILRIEIEPFYLFRIIHILIIIFVAVIYTDLIKKYLKSPTAVAWFTVSLFVIPNLYLSQVMVRADHLMFLFVSLIFYLWFRYDFADRLALSSWRKAAWAVCLIGMANSRNFAIFPFVIFFFWGLVVIFKNKLSLKNIILCVVILLLSGSYYIYRYSKTGMLLTQDLNNSYVQKYRKLQENFNYQKMLLNFQFDKLMDKPNRLADFEGGNAFLPRLYSDMWADHWLYFSGKPLEDKKIELKRAVLLSAIPFTLFYFFIPFKSAFSTVKKLFRKKALNAIDIAGFLFIGGLALLTLFVISYAEPGKNSSVKFTYIIPFMFFPLFPIAAFLEKHKKISRVFLVYTLILFIICLPLYIYVQ